MPKFLWPFSSEHGVCVIDMYKTGMQCQLLFLPICTLHTQIWENWALCIKHSTHVYML